MRSWSKSRTALVFIVAFVVAVSISDLATASDLCIANGGVTLVGKGFGVPLRGKCKPWLGYVVNFETGPNSSTGTACTASDGSHVAIDVTTMYPGSSDTIFNTIMLPIPLGAAGATFSSSGFSP